VPVGDEGVDERMTAGADARFHRGDHFRREGRVGQTAHPAADDLLVSSVMPFSLFYLR
jgi:hypothetical protein